MGLSKYKRVVGEDVISNIKQKAKRLNKKHVVFINSTYQGGGVAEMLNSLIPLFNDVGVKVGWRILHGNQDFFGVTKKFHNSLQGEAINLSQRKKDLYYRNNRRFSKFSHFDHDLVVVHDPQPLAMVDFYDQVIGSGRNAVKQPWIFRLHIDVSKPYKPTWNYLSKFMKKYDGIIVSKEDYVNPSLRKPHHIIHPCIDPLAMKNRDLKPHRRDFYLKKFGISKRKPIITQISRFDKWKDPLGVLKVFELVRKKRDCQLVLLGSLASDDPEGQVIYDQVQKQVAKSKYAKDIKVILVNSDVLVNVLQRESSVVIQKSTREGFGLTVSEALWKETPVVSSKVGGIPLQIRHGENGFLHKPKDYKGFANSILELLSDKGMCVRFGKHGKEFVRKNYLITRLMEDYLDLFDEYLL